MDPDGAKGLTTMNTPTRDIGLVWFRRDLRLQDNPAWSAATAQHDVVVALYVIDPRLFDRAGSFRRQQLLANLHALDETLAGHGGRLFVRHGDPVDLVSETVHRFGVARAYWNADVTPFAARRDLQVEQGLAIPVQTFWGSLVHAPGTVLTAKGTLSRVFTPFYKAWHRRPWDEWPVPGDASVSAEVGDSIPSLEVSGSGPGGETAALTRLEAFLDRVDDYETRRDLPAEDGTSLLSTDLRFGTLSPRTVSDVVGESTAGRTAFVRQLAWRDWYAHLLVELPEFPHHAMREPFDHLTWRNDPDDIAAWKSGTTGYPIVDAGIRQLLATGWMHNRVRMIVASFLVKDLLVDWRIGERYFRHLLVDGDVAQNVGNWQWVAGTGPDSSPYHRVFNPVVQSRKFDASGAYLRHWIPELARLRDDEIHAPWENAPLDLAMAGVELGVDYPHPIVEHSQARVRALDAYAKVRLRPAGES